MGDYSYETLRSVSEIEANEWDNVIRNSEYATVFHNIGYLKALEGGFGKDAAHVVAYRNGNLVGLFPNFLADIGHGTPFKRLVSLQPGSGAPVLTGNELEVLETLNEGVHDFAGGNIVSHTIRSHAPAHLLANGFLSDNGYRAMPGSRFEIDLRQNWEDIQASMSKDRRYDIRKANEQSYQVNDLEINRTNMGRFYKEYVAKMDELDKPTKPKEFFNILADGLADCIKIFSIEVDGEIRGYHFYFVDRPQSTIRHMWMAVLRDDFEYYPGELLHQHAIEWGIEKGFKKYDFGGGKADLRSGTSNYKRQFGGEIVPFTSWEKEFSNTFKTGRYISRAVSSWEFGN